MSTDVEISLILGNVHTRETCLERDEVVSGGISMKGQRCSRDALNQLIQVAAGN